MPAGGEEGKRRGRRRGVKEKEIRLRREKEIEEKRMKEKRRKHCFHLLQFKHYLNLGFDGYGFPH